MKHLDVEWLRLIKMAKDQGLQIAEIRDFMEQCAENKGQRILSEK